MKIFKKQAFFYIVGLCLASLAGNAYVVPEFIGAYADVFLAASVLEEQNIDMVEASQASVSSKKLSQQIADTTVRIPGQEVLTNPRLGNATLVAGTYKIDGNATLDGPLTITRGTAATTLIQVAGNLLVTGNGSVKTAAGTLAGNVFWIVEGDVSTAGDAKLPANIITPRNKANLSTAGSVEAISFRTAQAAGTQNTLAADLGVRLQITQNGVPVTPGQPIPYGTILTYTYLVENRGPDQETNVTAELTIPGINNDPGYSYSWNIGTLNSEQLITFTVNIRLDIPGASVVSISAAGNGTDNNPANNTATQTICVTPPAAGAISSNVAGNYLCEGSKVRFSIPTIQGAITYNWQVPQGWTWQALNAAQTSIEVTVGTGTGDISVFGSNACGNGPGATPRSYISVSPSAIPVKPVITSEGSLCTGSQITFRLTNPEAGISYRWNRPADWTVVNQNASSITFITSSAGAVSVTATNACSRTSVSDEIMVSTVPAAAVIASEGNLCIGGDITFRVVQPVAGMIYRWVYPAGWQVLETGDSFIRVVANSAGEIRATVTAANAMNCTSEPGEPITVSGVPAAAPVIQSNATPCAGDEITFSVANPPAGLIYQWNYPAEWTFVSRGAASITLVAGAGQVTAQAVNASGCVSAPSNIVTVTERPQAPTIGTDGDLCPGAEATFRIENPVAGVTYQWEYPTSWTLVSQTAGTVKVRVAAGQITARGSNAAGCSGEPSEPVTVLELPVTPVITHEGPLCPGTETEFKVESPVAGLLYNWSYPSDWVFVSQDNASIKLVPAAGQIAVRAENGAGCESGVSNSFQVPAAPAIPVISNQGALCVGNQVTFQISNPDAAQSYSWTYPSTWVVVSESSTSITLTVAAGQITARTTGGDCGPGEESEALVVTEVPAVPVISMSNAADACPGTEKTFTVQNAVAGVNYNWTYPSSWSFVSQSASSIRLIIGVGDITASAQSGSGCESGPSNTVTITETLPAAPAITSEGGLCVGSEVTFKITNPDAALTYQWNYPTTWTLLTEDASSVRLRIGSGAITATSLNSCGAAGGTSNAIVVSGPEEPMPALIVSEGTLCIGSEVTFRVASPEAGASYQWNYPSGWTILSDDGTSIRFRVGTGAITATALTSCGTPGEAGNAITVSDNTQPAAPVIAHEGGLCVGSTVTFRVSNPEPGLAYQWTYPSAWAVVSEGAASIRVVVGAGAISARAVNGCGIQSAGSNAITVVPGEGQLAAPVISSEGGLCAGGEVTFRVVSPEAGATYRWNYPSNWVLLSETASTIRLTVGTGAIRATAVPTTTAGCQSDFSNSITISDNVPPATPVILNEGGLCAGSEVLFRVAAPQAGISYQWNYPATWTLVAQDASSIRLVAGAGNISVTAINNCNALTAASTPIVVAPTPAKPGTIAASSSFCIGQQVVLTVDAVAGATSYVWSLPAGWVGASTGRSITVTVGSTEGTLAVSSRSGNCTSAASTLPVTPAALPAQPGAITASSAFCVGSQVTLSVPAVAGLNYTWAVPSGWRIDSPQGASSITVTVGGTAGAISVRAAGASGCASSTRTLNATPFVTPAQPGAITATATTQCVGQTVTFSVAAVTGATYYRWSLPTGWSITAGQGTTTITARVGAGAGSVSVTAGAGATGACASAASTLPVTPVALPAQPGRITVSGALCVGSQVTLSVPGVAGMSYTWAVPSGWTIDSPQDGSSISVTVGATNGAISVRAVNASGCTGTTRTLNARPFVTPEQPGAIIASGTQCVGQTTTFSIAAVSGATYYRWSLPAGWSITAGQGTRTITARVGAATGTVAVTAGTGAAGACASAASTLPVTPVALPAQPGTISANAAFCAGSQVTLSVPAVAGLNYTWAVPSGWRIDSPQGTSSVSVTVGATSGAISVRAVNASGCTGSARTLNVTPFAAPTQPGAIIANGAQCIGQVVTFSVATVAGASYYNWSVPAGWTVTAGQGTTSITARVGTTAGVVSVTAGTGNIGSCASAARTLPVSPVALPSQPGAIAASGAFCIGREITLSVPAEAGMTYNWTLPAGWVGSSSTNSILVTVGTAGGAISVTAANAAGCLSTARTLSATLIAAPAQPAAITFNSPLCVGQQVTFSIPSVAGMSYNWSLPDGWSGSSTTNTISVTVGSSAGIVSVSATNAGGCSSTARSLDVNPAVAPAMPGAITTSGSLCVGNQVTFTVENRPGITSYSWTLPTGWTGASTTNTITATVGAASGTISVVANAGGCPSPSATLPVTPVAAPAQPGAITPGGAFCAGREVTLSVLAVAGLSYNWSLPATWSIVSGNGTASITATVGTAGGTISVAAANGEGCNGPARTLAAALLAAPATPEAISASGNLCVGSQITLSVRAITGVTFRWSLPDGWTGTSTARTITVTVGATAGTVSVVTVNTGGCTSAASTLNVNPATPVAPGEITASGPFCATRQVTFNIEPVAGAASYAWTLPTGWTAVAGSTSTSITVTVPNNTTARVISVRAVGAGGCLSTASTLNVVPTSLPGQPESIAILQNALLCIGNKVTFSVTAVAGMTYNWQLPEGWEGSSTTNTIIATVGTTEGTVSVTATNATGCTSNVRTRAVTPLVVPAQPGEILASGPYCAGGTVTFSVEPVEGAASYVWSMPSGWSAVASSTTNSITYNVPNNTTTRTLTVVARGAGNCPSESRSITVTPLTVPAQPSVITGPTVVCPNTEGVEYSVVQLSNRTYDWRLPEGWVITDGEGTAAITVRTGETPGTVSVSAENACFSSVNNRSLAVSLRPGTPATPGPITSSGPLCAGTANTLISVDPVPGATTYTWEVPEGWLITAGQGNSDIEVTAGSTAGEIRVTAGNSCGTSAANVLAVNAQPRPETPEAIAGEIEPCAGRTGVVYTIPAVAGAMAYTWVVPAGWSVQAGQNTTSIRVRVGSSQGNISVIASNSCGTSAASTLAVRPVTGVPTAPGMISGEIEMCVGRTLTYTVVGASRATSYTWSFPTGWAITNGQGTTQVTVVAGIGSGQVSVVANNSCGTSLSSTMNVRAVQIAGASAILDRSSMCDGLIYEVASVAGASAYNWSVPSGWSVLSGQGTTRIRVAAAGNSVGAIAVVIDNGTCLSESVSLTPDLSLIASDLEFPNVFSPNNDGNNDTWAIENLGNYPNTEVSIINRWGNEVYRSSNYKNDWTGDNLSEGTYYYMARVKQCDGSDKVYKGFVMIMR
ncbi:T9SS type B sorting domain-containing protein [Pontibacter qinzhouensis]|uniref:T9SS type B sorting domain-containing protein n=1 Tax=Pontibacter qinzhouensis TaxID=2603253 RepID=A0A5C8KF71_9BACT|nr:gliding motility-associated C-terminal domain-containing protein [Pontibacter qinzhouensis]TXK51987.1 T9SS type B sorting domain-containing protein [Pontibacter qinzhouensis]